MFMLFLGSNNIPNSDGSVCYLLIPAYYAYVLRPYTVHKLKGL